MILTFMGARNIANFLSITAVCVLLVGGLGACQTTNQFGSGPLYFDKTSPHYQRYIKAVAEDSRGTNAFAISPSSKATGSSHWNGGQHYSSAISHAIKNCNEGADLNDCKIYAINGDVVWTNLVSPNDRIEVGSGEIIFSKRVQSTYSNYTKNRPANSDAVFVVAKNGQSAGFVWEGASLLEKKRKAIMGCNTSAASKGYPQDCALYAVNGEVVWKK